MTPFSRRSSSIPYKTKSGNGYFFSCSSFSMGQLLISFLKGALLFSFCLGFPIIQIDSTSNTNITSFMEFLDNSRVLLNSTLSFFVSTKPKEVLPPINVVQHWLIFPLFSVGQLSHVDDMLATIEHVQEFLLHLPLTIDGFGLQVGVLISIRDPSWCTSQKQCLWGIEQIDSPTGLLQFQHYYTFQWNAQYVVWGCPFRRTD